MGPCDFHNWPSQEGSQEPPLSEFPKWTTGTGIFIEEESPGHWVVPKGAVPRASIRAHPHTNQLINRFVVYVLILMHFKKLLKNLLQLYPKQIQSTRHIL